MKIATANKILFRTFFCLMIIAAGVKYGALATDITGVTSITISGDLTVTENVVVGGDEGDTPTNSLILWDSSTCPTGWTKITTYNNRLLRSDTVSGNSGTSTTHVHTSASWHSSSYSTTADTHLHTSSFGTASLGQHGHVAAGCGATDGQDTGSGNFYLKSGDIAQLLTHTHTLTGANYVAGGSHSHTISGTTSTSSDSSTSGSHLPLYRTITLCQK